MAAPAYPLSVADEPLYAVIDDKKPSSTPENKEVDLVTNPSYAATKVPSSSTPENREVALVNNPTTKVPSTSTPENREVDFVTNPSYAATKVPSTYTPDNREVVLVNNLSHSTIEVTPYTNAEDPHFYEDVSMITYTAKTKSKCSTSKPSTVTRDHSSKNVEDNVYEDASSAAYKVGKTKFKISISIKRKLMMATVMIIFVIISVLFTLFSVILAKNY